jgi:hypothetical protein
MDNKITPEQIDQLYTFTRQHFVEYYDLQTELVDHLANAIEATWLIKPNVSFNDALQMEFKKFGVFGFGTVVEKRQNALGKKYYKLMWGYFKQFFKLPHIILTIAIAFLTYKALAFEPLLYLPLQLGLIATIVYKTTCFKGKYGKKIKNTGKKWLFEEIIYSCGGIIGFIGIPFQFVQFAVKDQVSFATVCMLSFLLVFTGLLSYVMLFVIPAKAEDHLKAVYPEYNL